jgi:maleylpyruvate isomerase
MQPTRLLGQVETSTSLLVRRISGLTDQVAHEPSHLPGWTRGHLLTHLARNADAQCRTIAAALEGRIVEQYEGGQAGRERQIQEGAGRSGAALVDDVRTSAERLRAAWDALSDDGWALTQQTAAGRRTITDGLRSRWREVEVHFVDLDMLYTSEDWPVAFVDLFLPRTIERMSPHAKSLPAGVSWSLRDETSGAVWSIDGSGVRLSTEAATHQVVGPGHALLAWLLGRSFSAAIRVERSPNENAALLLPRFFPFP